jgi:hypothetical protein
VKNLFDYGEFLLCCGPVFLIIMMVGLALLWNSLPSQSAGKKQKSSEELGSVNDDIRTD